MTGFHDAYVAVPSRAAALRAWGATTDLFAMDAAEEVTDPKLMAAPLARPGEVVKHVRGSNAEHMAAAGPSASPKTRTSDTPKPKPRPSRADLDKAEKQLEAAEAERAQEIEGLHREKEALREREDTARQAFDEKRTKLEAKRRGEAEAYEEALKKWRAS
jgi:hypothetical protein